MVTQSLGRSSTLIATMQALGMAMALGVELLVAAYFGLGAEADAYFLALAIPLYVQEVVTASIPQVLVPRIGSLQATGSADAAGWVALAYGLAVALVCSVLGIALLASYSAILPMASGVAVTLVQRLLVPLVLVACLWPLVQALKALMNVQRRYLLANSDWLIMSAVAFVALMAGRPSLGIEALAWGQLAGVVVYLMLCVRPVPARRMNPVSFPEVIGVTWRLLCLSPLSATSAAIGSVPMLVARILMAKLGPGSVSALSYAFRIRSSLERLLFAPMGAAALAEASKLASDRLERSGVVAQSVALTLFVTVPVVVLLLSGPAQLMGMVYARGAFSSEDALLASSLLPWYGLGLAVSVLGRGLQMLLLVQVRLGSLLALRVLAVAGEVSATLLTVGLAGTTAPGIGWLVGNAALLMGTWAIIRREASGVLGLASGSVLRALAAGLAALTVGLVAFSLLPDGTAGNLVVALLALAVYWVAALVLGSAEAKPSFWIGVLHWGRR